MFVIKYPEKIKHSKKEVFILAYHGREGMAAAAGGWLLHCFQSANGKWVRTVKLQGVSPRTYFHRQDSIF